MTEQDEFWAAHDTHRDRINEYLTLAVDKRYDELLTSISADMATLTEPETTGLTIGFVAALTIVLEQAADASGVVTADFWRSHLLDIEEMMQRRRQGPDEDDI